MNLSKNRFVVTDINKRGMSARQIRFSIVWDHTGIVCVGDNPSIYQQRHTIKTPFFCTYQSLQTGAHILSYFLVIPIQYKLQSFVELQARGSLESRCNEGRRETAGTYEVSYSSVCHHFFFLHRKCIWMSLRCVLSCCRRMSSEWVFNMDSAPAIHHRSTNIARLILHMKACTFQIKKTGNLAKIF